MLFLKGFLLMYFALTQKVLSVIKINYANEGKPCGIALLGLKHLQPKLHPQHQMFM